MSKWDWKDYNDAGIDFILSSLIVILLGLFLYWYPIELAILLSIFVGGPAIIFGLPALFATFMCWLKRKSGK